MADKKTMFLVQVSVAPENIDKFLDAFKDIVELCCKEPECERFEVFADADEKGMFHWVETWNASREWVENVQVKKQYYEVYRAKTVPLWKRPLTVQWLEHTPIIPPYLKKE